MYPIETEPPGVHVGKKYLWPPRCTLSFYDGRRKVLGRFGQRWRRLDLSDTLMGHYRANSRVVYFGIRSDSVNWRDWDEGAVSHIEELIRNDLGHDGYRVSIRRETTLGTKCSNEFQWRLAIRPC